MDEVEEALGVLAFGYAGSGEPSRDGFRKAFASADGLEALRKHVVLLHCTSEYPAVAEEINLRAMDTLAQTFGLPVGFSDHSQGITIPIAAAARGAVVIEKHLTLDRTLPGPDHVASLEPGEFGAMVRAVRDVEKALGDGRKVPMPSELKTIPVARKSLIARKAIRRGEAFTVDSLTVKRPGNGVSPTLYWDYVGRTANRDYQPDDLIVETKG